MREQVDFLDTDAMDWASPRPGIFSKILSRDPETGARTALQRVVPADGYTNQPTAHCHDSSEEIFVVSGLMSFDSRSWLHAGGYVFHPPHWVHGFKSNVPQESQFVSRVSGDLRFTYFDETPETYPYSTAIEPDPRAAIIVPSPWAAPWEELPAASGRITRYVYGDAARTGGVTSLRRYRAGARDVADAAPLTRREEFFVFEGWLEAADGRVFAAGCYACLLPGAARPRFASDVDSLVYHHVAAEDAA